MTTSDPSQTIEVRGDTVEIKLTGSLELELAVRVVEAIAEVRTRHPRAFVLSPSSGSISPETRKFITEWLRSSSTPLETAVWGGGPVHRAISEMIFRGARLFRPGRFVVTFHRTRDDALAWIAARRSTPAPS